MGELKTLSGLVNTLKKGKSEPIEITSERAANTMSKINAPS